jgi:hypothetical protein
MVKHNKVSTVADPTAEVFDDAGACAFLVTNPRMLRKMRGEYALPFIRISTKSLRYRRKDLEEWLSRRRVQIAA